MDVNICVYSELDDDHFQMIQSREGAAIDINIVYRLAYDGQDRIHYDSVTNVLLN